MLAGAFGDINIADVSLVQQALANMAVGMFNSTLHHLTGLIPSTIPKVQYFRLDPRLRNL